MTTARNNPAPSREALIHSLYEAAELEHNLMCTYLYAAFSLKDGEQEGLSAAEAAAVARWRRAIMGVALEEMGHLVAVWNITSALGGAPRFGRGNFPLDPGALPAGIVVKLVPFGETAIQHFVHLERPEDSSEPEGEGFAPELAFVRGLNAPRLTPMAVDYETVGAFYTCLDQGLRAFVAQHGESVAFCGDPALQLSQTEVPLRGATPVICSKTALSAFAAIVEQGEGAKLSLTESHYHKFIAIRTELAALKTQNPSFTPAFPAATNPVLRRPMRATGRVWIEDEHAAATVDLANTTYALMLRLLAYSYAVPRPSPQKALAVDLALGLMRAFTLLAEHAARLPSGSSHPDCHAGVSFTALRDAAAFVPGRGAGVFFRERLAELAAAADSLAREQGARTTGAQNMLADLERRAARGFATEVSLPAAAAAPTAAALQTVAANPQAMAAGTPPTPTLVDGVEHIEGQRLTLIYDGPKCIHSRFCVTGAPSVFLANVKGPWIHPDAIDVDRLVEIAHACPSGAIRYRRKDGKPDETAPPVNLIAIREAGPYAVHAELHIDGGALLTRATLCRCGASKRKPFCDGSHKQIGFSASGEPATTQPDMLEVRDGPLGIDPQLDGPLQVRGNLEITSGTGRVVARVQSARLCRCGGSQQKPFCDGTHAKIGFRS